MRPGISQAIRFCLMWAGICLWGSPYAGAGDVHSPSVGLLPERVLEVQGGGEQFARAAQEYAQGCQLAAAGDARCVDWFFSTAVKSWEDLKAGLDEQPPRLLHGTLRLYNSAVLSAVVSGHRVGRLDCAKGLQVCMDDRWHTIPVVSKGLYWRLDQIDCLRPAETCFQNPTFACTVTHGVGAALLGIHYRRENLPEEEHFLEEHPFAVTAVIRGTGGPEGYRMELHNPVNSLTIEVSGRELLLTRNIAAAVEFAITHLEAEVNPWTAFFDPQVALSYQGVLLLEPYQPGKIPLVLVHGLLSNPATWGSMINEYLNNPELMERFQIWAYLYPTSVPYIQTASQFRRDLRNTLWLFDPAEQESALQQMILVGHSMGGLLSRLQVTWSGDLLWNEFANVPLGQVQGSPATRAELAEVFFFGPQPFVKRVVFIAVPHRGSSWSSRIAGLVGRCLAGRPTDLQTFWREFTRLNPGVLRNAFLRMGLPSSVDALASNSPSIRGISRLPFAPWVRLHSIIGTGGCEPCCPGDGVVSIQSARLPGVDSEVFVDAKHSKINQHPHTIQEVERILWIHWAEYERQTPPNAPDFLMPISVPSPSE